MENDSKPADDVNYFLSLSPFFFGKLLFLEKIEKRYFIFCYKIGNIYWFHAFTIRTNLGNVSESDEFRFENSLKRKIMLVKGLTKYICKKLIITQYSCLLTQIKRLCNQFNTTSEG